MAGVLGRAFIQVFADLSKFTPGLKQEIKKALDEQTKGLRFEELDKSAEKAGESAADELAKGVDSKIENNMKKEGNKGGLSLWRGLSAGFSVAATAFLPTLIALAVELVAALAPAVTALAATLPTAIAGAIVSAAVLKMAFSGVGAALKTAFNPAKAAQFNEALKKLAPAARSFVLEIRALHPAMHQLQQDVQQAFFLQLQGVLTRTVHTLLPTLHRGLLQISADLGRMGQNLIRAFGAHQVDLAGIFTAAHRALYPFIPLVGQLVGAFMSLANAAGPFVAILSAGLARLLGQFATFVQSAASSGGLAAFFQDALVVLRQFGGLLHNVFDLVTSIIGALNADGGQALGMLSGLVGLLAAFFRTAQGKEFLAALFRLLNTVLSSLLQVLAPLLPALGQMATVLANGISDALVKITPKLVAFSNWLAKHKDLLYAAVGAWVAYKGAVMAAAAAEAIADALNPLGAAILGIALYIAWVVTLIKHWKMVEHYAQVVLDAIGRFFAGIWSWITSVGKDIGNWFTVTVPNFFESLPGKIWAALSALPGLLGRLFTDALRSAGEAIGIGIGLIAAYVIKWPGMLWDEVKAIGHLFSDLFHLALADGRRQVDLGVAAIMFIFTQLPGKIGNFLMNTLPNLIGRAFKAAWDWAKRETFNAGEAIVTWAHNLPGRLGNFMRNVGHDIVAGLKAGINAVIGGFNSGIDRVASFVHIGLPHIPLLAEGGLIKAPTLAIVGDAGPEAVIPMGDPGKAVRVAQKTGLLDILGSRMGNVGTTLVRVYLGTREITDILDTRIEHALGDQAQQLAFGMR